MLNDESLSADDVVWRLLAPPHAEWPSEVPEDPMLTRLVGSLLDGSTAPSEVDEIASQLHRAAARPESAPVVASLCGALDDAATKGAERDDDATKAADAAWQAATEAAEASAQGRSGGSPTDGSSPSQEPSPFLAPSNRASSAQAAATIPKRPPPRGASTARKASSSPPASALPPSAPPCPSARPTATRSAGPPSVASAYVSAVDLALLHRAASPFAEARLRERKIDKMSQMVAESMSMCGGLAWKQDSGSSADGGEGPSGREPPNRALNEALDHSEPSASCDDSLLPLPLPPPLPQPLPRGLAVPIPRGLPPPKPPRPSATATCMSVPSPAGRSEPAHAGGVSGAPPRIAQPAQDVSRKWRCKCSTINKAGSFKCTRQGCGVYFCLKCGQLGHQQRFCRQPSSRSNADEGARGEEEFDDGTIECVVCMDAVACDMLLPCKHKITCMSCTSALLQFNRPCPFCSTPIIGVEGPIGNTRKVATF